MFLAIFILLILLALIIIISRFLFSIWQIKILRIDLSDFYKLDPGGREDYLHRKYLEQLHLLKFRLRRDVESHSAESLPEMGVQLFEDPEARFDYDAKKRIVVLWKPIEIKGDDIKTYELEIYDVPCDLIGDFRRLWLASLGTKFFDATKWA